MANQTVIDVGNSSDAFFHQLQAEQQTMWGENQTALGALSKAWAPVLSSGVIPYGYSAGLDSLLQANVLQTSATATSNAENAAALQEKQASGGANVGPTGSNEAINAEILARGQQSAATGLQNEKIAGYKQGVQNLEGATQAEMGIIDATNPEKAAEAALGAGNLAETAGAERFKENQSTGPLATFEGIAGGLANLGTAVTGFSKALNPTGGQGGSYHKGGIVRGKRGKEVSAKLMPGEYVIPEPKTKKQKSLLDRALANA